MLVFVERPVEKGRCQGDEPRRILHRRQVARVREPRDRGATDLIRETIGGGDDAGDIAFTNDDQRRCTDLTEP